MASTSPVYARIDSELKASAENILGQLGISPSGAIQMLYSQIVLQNGMPFVSKLPGNRPIALGALSREELDKELQAGIDSLKAGKKFTADEVDMMLAEEFGI